MVNCWVTKRRLKDKNEVNFKRNRFSVTDSEEKPRFSDRNS